MRADFLPRNEQLRDGPCHADDVTEYAREMWSVRQSDYAILGYGFFSVLASYVRGIELVIAQSASPAEATRISVVFSLPAWSGLSSLFRRRVNGKSTNGQIKARWLDHRA